MTHVRVGVIGAGLIWDNAHKNVLKSLNDRIAIAAFSVRSQATRDKLAVEFGDVPCYEDYREIIRSKMIDAVVILTPIPLNAPIALEALQAGKHVFVEKPMAATLEDANRMVEMSQSTGRKLYVLEQARYREPIILLKRLLETGRIGTVVSYERVSHHLLDITHPDGYGKTGWRIEPDFPLGGLYDGGIHDISELTYLFGTPESVYARGNNLRESYGDNDQVVMIFGHPNGVIGTFSHSSLLDWHNNYFHIRGTRGTINFSFSNIKIQGEVEEEIPVVANNDMVKMWTSCLDDLTGREAVIYRAEEGCRDVRVLHAVDKSIKSGEGVNLE
jgi:scyllo-inositol 2-dehydrogenase (NADP+)